MGSDCRAEGRVINLKNTVFGGTAQCTVKIRLPCCPVLWYWSKRDTKVPGGKQMGTILHMSQQHSALLYSCMPWQHGPRLEQLYINSSSCWQHHEKKVSWKKWVCFRLFYYGVAGGSIWVFEADNFPSELISLQVFPNPFLERVWSKGIRAKDHNNSPCSASSLPPHLQEREMWGRSNH